MTDVFSKAQRSRVMAAIRSKDTGPERRVAALLRAAGVRFRRHVAALPGTPDFVVAAARAAVFVHGCFWHGHEACGKGADLPAVRRAFWRAKLARNRARDRRAARALRKAGWSVFVVWECALARGRTPAVVRRLTTPSRRAERGPR